MPAVIPELERQEEIAQDDEERLFKKLETALKSEFKELGVTRAELMVLAHEGKSISNELRVAYEEGLTEVVILLLTAGFGPYARVKAAVTLGNNSSFEIRVQYNPLGRGF